MQNDREASSDNVLTMFETSNFKITTLPVPRMEIEHKNQTGYRGHGWNIISEMATFFTFLSIISQINFYAYSGQHVPMAQGSRRQLTITASLITLLPPPHKHR